MSSMSSNNSLNGADIGTMVAYFVLLFVVFIYSVFNGDRSNTEGYFLANRNMNWFLIGMSLFSTNIGAEHFLGLAGSGAAKGLSAAAFEINAMLVMQMLSWIFLPVLVSSQVQTLPEYFSTRLGGKRIRCLLAIVYLIIYIFTKVSVNLYAGALFLQTAFQLNLYIAIAAILIVTAMFTVIGGLKSVMYTDTFMSVIMLFGGTVLSSMALKKVGGFHGLYVSYMKSAPTITNITAQCAGIPTNKSFQMLRTISDEYIPWLGFLLGHTPNTIWYWCSDQMMVQRVLAAKSLSHAKGGTLLTGFLKVTPLFLMVLVGMASRALNPDTVGCSEPDKCESFCLNRRGCSNVAYPTIALQVLPNGMKGIIVAVMISALISGLTSLYNSSSTLFTLDVYKLVRKNANNMETMIVGRVFALIIIALSIAWIPLVILMTGTDIYVYIQSVNSFYAAPIASVYLMTVFWKRVTETGSFYALVFGFVIGTIRLIMQMSIPDPLCGETDNRLSVVKNVNFIYFSLLSFSLTTLVNIIISLLTKQLNYDKFIRNKTYWTRSTKRKINNDFSDNVVNARDITTNDVNLSQSSNIEVTQDEDVVLNETHNQDNQSSLTTLANSENEQKKTSKRTVLDKLTKILSSICGIKKEQSATPTVDYNVILKTFNEYNQTNTSKYLTSTFLIILAIFEFVIFLIFSLPSLPLFL